MLCDMPPFAGLFFSATGCPLERVGLPIASRSASRCIPFSVRMRGNGTLNGKNISGRCGWYDMGNRYGGCIKLMHKHLCNATHNSLISGLCAFIFKRAKYGERFVKFVQCLYFVYTDTETHRQARAFEYVAMSIPHTITKGWRYAVCKLPVHCRKKLRTHDLPITHGSGRGERHGIFRHTPTR